MTGVNYAQSTDPHRYPSIPRTSKVPLYIRKYTYHFTQISHAILKLIAYEWPLKSRSHPQRVEMPLDTS